jgi:hypothetical protein
VVDVSSVISGVVFEIVVDLLHSLPHALGVPYVCFDFSESFVYGRVGFDGLYEEVVLYLDLEAGTNFLEERVKFIL